MAGEHLEMKRYHSENSNRYADLMGMLQDLNEAALHFHMGEMACEPTSASYGNQLVAKAHWYAGAMLYARVFYARARPFNRQDLFLKMHVDLAEFHVWLLETHDQHCKPAENIFEEIIPAVSRVNGDTGVSHVSSAGLNPKASVFHQCYRFVKEVVRLVQFEAHVAHSRFQTEAEMLDDQFLSSLPASPRP